MLLAIALLPLRAQTKQAGRQLFESTCAGCHGLDGKGGEHAPNIAKLRQRTDADLQRVIHNGMPANGMPAFQSVFDNDQITTIIAYLRTLQATQKVTPVSGDGEAGRLLFKRVRCAECHTANGQGGFLATDLSGYGVTHSADDLRQQILHHREDERYEWIKVITRSGREYTGLIRNEDNFSLQLQTPNGDFLFFEKAQVTKTERQPRSITPMNNSNEWEIRDLNNLNTYLSQPSATSFTLRK
ncbi:MAG: c-type cytochrome [Acidobacteriaceae bacterium]|nr:c-type cytochrome [Acidobacteriaceae bacterium]